MSDIQMMTVQELSRELAMLPDNIRRQPIVVLDPQGKAFRLHKQVLVHNVNRDKQEVLVIDLTDDEEIKPS